MAERADGTADQRAIREFLAAELGTDDLRDDEDIFESGYVNSLFAMELITFIEGTFGITIENEDLELENFSSVDRITTLVRAKTALTV